MRELIEDLIAVGNEQIRHEYHGECPDRVEGPDVRDEDCAACKVLIAADRALKGLAA